MVDKEFLVLPNNKKHYSWVFINIIYLPKPSQVLVIFIKEQKLLLNFFLIILKEINYSIIMHGSFLKLRLGLFMENLSWFIPKSKLGPNQREFGISQLMGKQWFKQEVANNNVKGKGL